MDKVTARIIQLCKEYKAMNSKNFYSNIASTIADEFGVLYSTEHIRGISKRYRRENGLDENFTPFTNKETVYYGDNTERVSNKTISIKRGEVFTEERLLTLHGYDPDKFVLTNAKNTFWTVDGDRECYSSRITVKPKTEFVWTQETIDKILDGLNIPVAPIGYEQDGYSENGKALVLPIADLHYAMRASSSATDDRYNRNVASGRYYHVLEDVLARVYDRKFEKIFFVIGNDFLNSDNRAGTTTKGTPQDNDGDIESAIIEATDMVIRAVDILRRKAPVDVIHIPANHDNIVSFGIANAVRARYANDENVYVDCGYRERKYRKFGNTLLGFAHDIKVQNVNDIVSRDAREYISDTTNTVYFLAHLHHEECMDVYGTDVRRLPTVSSTSRWAYEKGYYARKKCQSFIIDEEKGITDVIYTVI